MLGRTLDAQKPACIRSGAMAAPAGKMITGYTRSGRPIYGTEVGKQYRTDVAVRHTRATARKASLLDKLLKQAAQLHEATGVDVFEETAVKDIITTKGAIYHEKTRIENEGGSMDRYRELLREEAPLDSRFMKELNKALKAHAPVDSAESVRIGLAPDEEAEMDALDAELMGLMSGLKMAGGARRHRRTSRRHRKSQRRH